MGRRQENAEGELQRPGQLDETGGSRSLDPASLNAGYFLRSKIGTDPLRQLALAQTQFEPSALHEVPDSLAVVHALAPVRLTISDILRAVSSTTIAQTRAR